MLLHSMPIPKPDHLWDRGTLAHAQLSQLKLIAPLKLLKIPLVLHLLHTD